MDINRIDYLDLKGNGNLSKDLFRQFIKKGTMFLIRVSLKQADDALIELNTYAKDNFCIIYDDINDLHSKNYTAVIQYNKGQLWNDVLNNANVGREISDTSTLTFALFVTIYEGVTTILPPAQIYLNIVTDYRYTPYGFVLYEDRYIFSYIKKDHLKGKRVKMILGNSGSSSAVLTYPIIMDMVKKYEEQGMTCDFYYNYTNKSFAIYPYIFPKCHHILFHPDVKIYSLCDLLNDEINSIGQYGEIRHMIMTQNNYISSETEGHIVNEMMTMAGYSKGMSGYRNLLTRLEKLNHCSISPYMNKAIRIKRRYYRYIIGVQFESITDFEHIHDRDSIIKKWLSPMAEEFIHLCAEYDICICSLSRPEQNCDNIINAGHLSVGELFGLISQLDLVVGIDSICCYIASVLSIPNMSIWRYSIPCVQQTPNGGSNLSLRPPNMNHSIVLSDGNIVNIKPERLLKTVLNLLEKPGLLAGAAEQTMQYEEW